MSLSGWEQQALASIKDGLASSDPRLAARLDMFTRLASGEEMPPREKIQASRPRPGRPRRNRARGPAHRMYQRLGLSQALLLLWLVVTAAMIIVSLASDRVGSQDACTASWARSCTGAASAPDSAPGAPGVLGALLPNARIHSCYAALPAAIYVELRRDVGSRNWQERLARVRDRS